MLFVIFFEFINIAFALVSDGPCPNVQVVSHMNLSKMKSGPWYQVARYPNDIEKKGDCVTLKFDINNKKSMMYIHEIVDGKVEEFAANLKHDATAGDSGKLIMFSSNFTESADKKSFPLYVLDLDYDNYCIGYSCSYDPTLNKKQEYLWITSLQNTLDTNSKAAIKKLIKNSQIIDETKLIWDNFDFDHCKVSTK